MGLAWKTSRILAVTLKDNFEQTMVDRYRRLVCLEPSGILAHKSSKKQEIPKVGVNFSSNVTRETRELGGTMDV